MAESPTPAIAILSYGKWYALCPTDSNAMPLDTGQTRFECSSPDGYGSDGTTADVEWPADPDAVFVSVQGLPVEQQNWSPS